MLDEDERKSARQDGRADLERAPLAEAVGVAMLVSRPRRDFALECFARMRARAQDGPAPSGLHILMGPSTAENLSNTVAAVAARTIAPTAIFAGERPD